MVDLGSLPKPKIIWTVTIGSLLNSLLLVGTIVWGVSAFAANTVANSAADKTAVSSLRAQSDKLAASDAMQDSKLAGIETSILYIRESLARIEAAIVKRKD